MVIGVGMDSEDARGAVVKVAHHPHLQDAVAHTGHCENVVVAFVDHHFACHDLVRRALAGAGRPVGVAIEPVVPRRVQRQQMRAGILFQINQRRAGGYARRRYPQQSVLVRVVIAGFPARVATTYSEPQLPVQIPRRRRSAVVANARSALRPQYANSSRGAGRRSRNRRVRRCQRVSTPSSESRWSFVWTGTLSFLLRQRAGRFDVDGAELRSIRSLERATPARLVARTQRGRSVFLTSSSINPDASGFGQLSFPVGVKRRAMRRAGRIW